VIGFALEAFVFCYLGLSYFAYAEYYWAWSFIAIEFGICILARIIGTVGLIQIMRIFGHKPKVSFK
jgi:hypothetical protein